MNSDSGDRISRPKRDLWPLPDILAVEVRRRHFEQPRRRTVDGVDEWAREGLEVVVELSQPVPIRALGLVLWVGEVPLTIAESDGEREYRFLATDREHLMPGAPISLSWNAVGAKRNTSGHRLPPESDSRDVDRREPRPA